MALSAATTFLCMGLSSMNRIIPLNWYQKMGYGLGDTACNLVWSSIMLFMAYFYTDIFGLSPAHMGTMFLAVRVIDAFFDVGIGAVTDRTRTKYGQFRPYLLWFAIPFSVMCMLTFYTPDFSYTGKLIYAYCSYTLLSLLYSAINVPYCAMINNISQSSVERVSLQSWRFAMSSAGGLLVSVAALPAVAWLGKGNIQNGYFYAMVLISSLGIILFYLCFFLTKETSIATIDANRGSLLQDLRILLKNRDWRILFTLNVVNLVAVIFKMGIIIYFCNYVLRRSDLSSMMITISIVSGLAGTILSVYIFRGMDKVRGFKLAMLLEAILLALLYFFSQSSLIIIFAFIIAINFIQLAATPLQWAMLSDVVDAIERDTGKKMSGIVFSTNLFAIKLGIAIGGALMGWLLSWSGYIGGAAQQPQAAILTIKLIFTILPAVLVLALVLIMRRYSLSDRSLAMVEKTSTL